jgi:hypothetical protein
LQEHLGDQPAIGAQASPDAVPPEPGAEAGGAAGATGPEPAPAPMMA